MEITGKIIVAMDPVGGTSKAGNVWKKRDYVLETQETYPRKVAFNFFGDRVDQFPLEVGQLVTISFDIESREWQGRWYTDIRAWKAEPAGQGAPAAAPMGSAPVPPAVNYGQNPNMPNPGSYPAPPAPQNLTEAGPTDDLPF